MMTVGIIRFVVWQAFVRPAKCLFLLLTLAFLSACANPTSTKSNVPLLLTSPALGDVPASFIIYNPALMGTAMQAEFQSDGAGHHLLALAKEEGEAPEQMRGYMRLMRLPLFPDHYVAEITSEDGSQQILLKRTPNGFQAETIDLGKVLKKEKVAGVKKVKDKDVFEATNIDAVQLAFWRALDLSNRGKVPKSEPYEFVIYNLDTPQGRPAYDAARAAEADRLAREKAAEEVKKKRVAAEKEQKRLRREAEKKRKADAEKVRRAGMVANNNKRYGDWIYRIELDAMTDKKKQYIYGIPQGFETLDRSPYLRIGCYGANDQWPMGVTFFWGQSLEDIYPRDELDMARVTVRFGGGTPQEMGWSVSQDWASTYPPNAVAGGIAALSNGIVGLLLPNTAVAKMNTVWEAMDLHRALRTSSKATFRGYPRSGQNATYVFDLGGYREAAQNFEKHCNR